MNGSEAADWGARIQGHRRIAVLTEGHATPFLSKTANSLVRYRTRDVAAIVDSQTNAADAESLLGVGAGIPVVSSLSPGEFDSLYIGIAPPGGQLPAAWRPIILAAIRAGIDVVSGLHEFLADDPEYLHESQSSGALLMDVRRNRFRCIADGQPFRAGCCRIYTAGHDCSVGKMVAAIETDRGLRSRGVRSRFLATGQTGIMVSGAGIPADCIVSDFINGSVEALVRKHDDDDFLLIEGQGSISHPAYSAVTAGILHGACPDGIIWCYEAGRDDVKGLEGILIPPPEAQLQALLQLARLRHPCELIGVAVNTRYLNERDARAEVDRAAERFRVPACDVFRDGADRLVEAAIALGNRKTAAVTSSLPSN